MNKEGYFDNNTPAGSELSTTDIANEIKLVAPNGEPWEHFGFSVAIDGEYAVVGAHGTNGIDTGDPIAHQRNGAVYIYKYNGAEWELNQRIASPVSRDAYSFGKSVAISGDKIIIGAASGAQMGAAYIYTRDGSSWGQEAVLIPSDAALRRLYGNSVAIHGSRAIVGASDRGPDRDEPGRAYIFAWDGTGWKEEAILIPSDGEAGDSFGVSVSIYGSHIIVGASGHNYGMMYNNGAAYTYLLQDGVWVEKSKLINSDNMGYEAFGSKVSISGNRALITSMGHHGAATLSGAAYIFEWNGEEWMEAAKLEASDAQENDRFGISGALSGDRIVIGKVKTRTYSNAVYSFYFDGNSWQEQMKLIPSDGMDNEQFGTNVSLSGDRTIIGAYGHSNGNGPQNYMGAAYIYTLPPLDTREIVVNSIADRAGSENNTNCDTGEMIEIDGELVPECTLRAALEVAAARGGENPITFNIPGSGPHTISLQSMLPEIPAQTLLDASTQTGFETAPLIAINGNNAISTAFTLTQDESAIRGFSIGGFTGAGITITGGNKNLVEQCFIGVASDGRTPTPNGEGIRILDAEGNHIGNLEGKTANVISANLGAGVVITGEASRDNIIAATYIGTNIAGNAALPNQSHGIVIDNAPDNTLGGVDVKQRNLISGNLGSGIVIRGSGATGNQVLGNYIGTTVAGNNALPNEESGVLVEEGASENQIGAGSATTGKAPGNLISGNTLSGVMVTGTAEKANNANKIQGNIIGLNAAGNAAIPNGEVGIQVIGRATEIEIGGPTPNHGNVVSGHSLFQIELADEADNVSPASPYIANNIVGLSMTGNATIKPISIIGIKLGGADRIFTEIGVPDFRIEDNLVAGNNAQIYILGQLSANGEISGNTIGLFRNGNIALPDSSIIGLWIVGATHLKIGRPDKGNVIGGNTFGMLLAASFSQVAGNKIGVNAAGNLARANTIGVLIPGEVKEGSSTMVSPTGMSNIIGIQLDEAGNIEDGRNIISGNKGPGIAIVPDFGGTPSDAGDKNLKHTGPDNMKLPETGLKALAVKYLKDNAFAPADSNIIGGNYIGLSASGGSLGNGKSSNEDKRRGGVEITRGRGNYIIHNHIGDNGMGVAVYRNPDFLFGPGNTYISGNAIGTRMSGTNMMPRPNQSYGIVHQASSHLYIGIAPDNPLMLNPNIIAQNNDYGVFINRYTDSEAGESNVSLRGNAMASNKKGAYLIASSLENTGGDLDGVPYPPELLLISVDSARVKISGSAPEPGEVDFYSGKPDHYGDDAIATRYYKKTIALAGTTQFALNESLDTLSLKEGDYISATLNVAPEDGFYMTSHFSPAIRVAKADNVVEVLLSEGDASELLARLGITTGRDESEEPQDDEKLGQEVGNKTSLNLSSASDGNSSLLYATLHELAPEFNYFSGDAITAGGSHYAAPDTLLASHYWTLAGTNLTIDDFYVCLDISAIDLQALFAPSGNGHPAGRSASDLVLLQRSHAGAPWQARDTYFNPDSTAICARNLYPKGDFAIGFNAAGEITSKARFTVIFDVSDQNTNPIEGAIITLAQQQNPTGGYEFPEVPSGNYEYLVRANGFFDNTGSFTVARQDTIIQVMMVTDNTSIVSLKENEFLIFPNPNSGQFTLQWGDMQPEVVTIFDMQGRQVYQQSITSNEQQAQLIIQQAKAGLYIVQIRTAASMIRRQLMIR